MIVKRATLKWNLYNESATLPQGFKVKRKRPLGPTAVIHVPAESSRKFHTDGTAAVPSVWNFLKPDFRSAFSLNSFKSRLKTAPLSAAYYIALFTAKRRLRFTADLVRYRIGLKCAIPHDECRPWALGLHGWINHWSPWRMASATPELRLISRFERP